MSQEKLLEMDLDIIAIVKLLISKIYILVIFAAIGASAGYGIAKNLVAPLYCSDVSIYVNSMSESADTDGGITKSNMYASKELADTYIVILENDEVLDEVGRRVATLYSKDYLSSMLSVYDTDSGYAVSSASLRQCISYSSVNDTEVLNVKATTKDPQLSADLCRLVTEVSPPVIQRVVKAGDVEVIGSAKVNKSPISPNTLAYVVIGFVLGVFAAVCFIFICLIADNTVKGERDIKELFAVPVLGEIPDIAAAMKEDIKREAKK